MAEIKWGFGAVCDPGKRVMRNIQQRPFFRIAKPGIPGIGVQRFLLRGNISLTRATQSQISRNVNLDAAGLSPSRLTATLFFRFT